MLESTAASNPYKEVLSYSRVPDPQIFRRTFHCGHPEEWIEIRFLEDGGRLHNMLTFEVFKEFNQAENRPTYIEARCLKCAKEAKRIDDKDAGVQPKKTLSAYRSGTSSTYRRSDGKILTDAFESSIWRYRWADKQNQVQNLHPRVSEQEHQAHRHEIIEEAVKIPRGWLALPARRVTGLTIGTTGGVDVAAFLERISHPLEEEYEVLFRDKLARGRIDTSDDETGHQTSYWPSGSAPEADADKSKYAAVTIAVKETADRLARDSDPSVKNSPKNDDEEFQLATRNTESLSSSRISRRSIASGRVEASPVSINAASPSGMFELHQADGSHRPSKRVSDLMEPNMNRPLHELFSRPFNEMKYEKPRPAPVVPRRRPLSFGKRRRSSINTRASTQSEPGSKNFRKLNLDIFQSAMYLGKKDRDVDSPDWACITSLAIEAGRISMDDVDMRRPTSSKYSIQSNSTSTELVLPDRSKGHGMGSASRGKAQSLASSKHSLERSTRGRHSEGALQDVRRLIGRGSMLGREPSKRQHAQRLPPIHLNKSLPALPSPENGKDSET